MTMPDGVPQGPWHPTAQPNPIGLDFDRGDLADDDRTIPAGVEVAPLPGRNTATFKGCGCGVLVGEYCDCAEFAAGLALAPVVHLPPYDLRALREQHVTAAELHAAEHGRGAA